MNMAEKLQVLRKNKGLSQEELAELLSVSRQAVGKWEYGQSYPDLDKLIQLSELYSISLDRLVKDQGDCNLQIGEGERVREDITDFLIRAKRACYAGHGQEVGASRHNSHDLEYREDDLYYYDTYLGSECFGGEEAVWKSDNPIWCMNYCGRVTGEHFSGDFLKAALAAVPYDMPYRGPALFQSGSYTYHCKVEGNFGWYQGCEEILHERIKIYECYFHGGTIR
ncbi:MAG: helix-turn-helix transcriptional regulator [Clostridiales bacterium]|nr:helix-turn-helix transcriptional regulator [Clostridiales bacterium]